MPLGLVLILGMTPIAVGLANLTIYGLDGTKARLGVLARQALAATVLVVVGLLAYRVAGDAALALLMLGAVLVWYWLNRRRFTGTAVDPAVAALATDPRRRRWIYMQAAAWTLCAIAIGFVTDGVNAW